MISRIERMLTPRVMLLAAVALFQLLALGYAPGFRAPFVYDDLPNIVYNADFRAEDAVSRILGPHPESTQYDRRPVSGLLTWLNYKAFGLNVTAYRAVNLLIHWACALAGGGVVYLICRRVMRGGGGRAGEAAAGEAPGGEAAPRLLAAVSAVLWAVHPVHSTAVIYINQRQETLMTLFFLLSCLCLLLAGARPRREGMWRALSAAAALLSLLAKENAAGLIVVLAVTDRLFVAGSWSGMWRRHRLFWGGFAVLWAAALIWIASGVRLKEWDDIPALASPWEYFKTECRVVFNYLRLLVWPEPLIFAPAPRLAERWTDWLPYGLVLCALFGGGALAALRRPWLWIPWLSFLLVLAPTSSFIPVPLEPDFDYRMHLPAFAALATVISLLWRSRLPRLLNSASAFQAAAWVLAVVIALLTGVVRNRARDYTAPESIWLDTVRKEPANVKAWVHLAHVLLSQGRYAEVRSASAALQQLNGLLGLSWIEAERHKIAGLLAVAERKWPEAAAEYRQAFALLPERPDFAAGLAQALLNGGKPGDALACLEAVTVPAVRDDPAVALCRAQALLALGRREEALRAAALVEDRFPFPPPEVSAALGAWKKALEAPPAGAAPGTGPEAVNSPGENTGSPGPAHLK